MPDPLTRDEYQAVKKRAAASAPEGLSREQFRAFVDAEIDRQSQLSYPMQVAERLGGSVKKLATNPSTYATLAGLGAMPFTGGMSLLPAMAAEGAAVGAGTLFGHGVKAATGDPSSLSDVAGDTAKNAALGTLGPVAGKVLGGARSVLGAAKSAARRVPSVALDVAEHAPYGVGTAVRLARGVGRLMPDAPTAPRPPVATPEGLIAPNGAGARPVAPPEPASGIPTATPRPASGPVPVREPPRPVPAPADPTEQAFMRDLLAKRTAARANGPSVGQQVKRAPPATAAKVKRAPRPSATAGAPPPLTIDDFGGLSAWEKQAIRAEQAARGMKTKIPAHEAADYLRDHGTLIPPGTSASRQARHISDAQMESRFKFLMDNPKAAIGGIGAGGMAALPDFRKALMQALQEDQP